MHSYAQIIYVDTLLPTDCNGTYSISNRACNGVDGDAYKTLKSAANAGRMYLKNSLVLNPLGGRTIILYLKIMETK